VHFCQANTQYVEGEIEKLNGEQLVELKVSSSHFGDLSAMHITLMHR